MMSPRPKHLGPEYAAVFKGRSVADAYVHRPPYPDEAFELLHKLMFDQPRYVLELGCGTGEVARRLAPDVDRVDAVDPSAAMLAIGKGLPGGGHPNLNWVRSSAEDFDYPAGYALAITAESLGWLDWNVVFPLLRRALSHHARLVVLVRDYRAAWDADTLDGIVPRYSTNRDFVAFDLSAELQKHGLFAAEGRMTTAPAAVRQSVDDYIEFWHSRSGFSRERMGKAQAERFDEEVRRLVTPHATDKMLRYDVIVHLAWGRPGLP